MQRLLIEFINTLDVSLKKRLQEIGAKSGFSRLTISQFQYIDAIHELGEPAISDIANRLNITKASVTSGVNKLIDMGYLTKTQSNQDRRVFRVQLTEAGMHMISAKYQTLKEYEEFICAALSPDEARQFEAILAKLVKSFEQG